MKQTAIEWLMSQILGCTGNREDGTLHIIIQKDAFNKAMDMEKEQICNAWFGGYLNGECKTELKSEQYYNDKYNYKYKTNNNGK